MNQNESKKKVDPSYWRANVIVISILLSIWAIVAYGCSILFVESLNQIRFFDLPLGFWFANQGSMYVFVILIFVYAIVMESNRSQVEEALELNDGTD